MAELHPQLSKDCYLLGRFSLCQLLLARDSNYPWFILVPDREQISEIYHLNAADRSQLLLESCLLSEFLVESFAAYKLNIAALGNLVPQLHLHHVVRYQNDPAWPAPIWGKCEARAYDDHDLAALWSRITGAELPGFTLAEGGPVSMP